MPWRGLRRRFAGRPTRYAAVGAIATATHYATLVALVEWTQVAPWLGAGIGAAVGAQVAYFGNRRYTFEHRGAVAASWPRFMATATLGGVLGMAIVAGGVRLGLWYLAAQVVATAVGLVATYAINRRWTFG